MGAIAPPPAYADTQAPGMYRTEKKSIGWYFVHSQINGILCGCDPLFILQDFRAKLI